MKTALKLDARLSAAADLIRKDSFVCDVGTDHAYLPIFLCMDGKIRGGVVSDINEGPTRRAKENINKFGLGDKLTAIKTDGLHGIEKYSPEDIMILGMGGELIARIIDEAMWTKNNKIRLCLQPMTHPELLRSFLLENGYSILEERLAKEDGRIYQIILAQYSGKIEIYHPEELVLGRHNILSGGELFREMAEGVCRALDKKIAGLESGGNDASDERALAQSIRSLIR